MSRDLEVPVEHAQRLHGTRDFGLVDKKGRRIGAKWITQLVDIVAPEEGQRPHWTGLKPGRYVRIELQATRAEKAYGPIQSPHFAPSERAAEALIENKLRAMARRYERACANGSV